MYPSFHPLVRLSSSIDPLLVPGSASTRPLKGNIWTTVVMFIIAISFGGLALTDVAL
jgi:hypothetical protein